MQQGIYVSLFPRANLAVTIKPHLMGTNEIGKRIASLRKAKGITQKELGEALFVTDKAVSRWESGAGNPDLDCLPRIAEYFGVSLDYLITGKSVDDTDKEGEKEPLPVLLSQAKKPSRRKKIIIAFVAAAVVAATALTLGLVFGLKRDNAPEVYKNAVSLLEAGEFEASAAMFSKIPDYQDSRTKIEVCYGLVSISKSKRQDDYSLLKEGTNRISAAGEIVSVTYNGDGVEIKDGQKQFADQISNANPGIFEPSIESFSRWKVSSVFYLSSNTNLLLMAVWAN